jgi:F-type H+-transporting ATPase subunit b
MAKAISNSKRMTSFKKNVRLCLMGLLVTSFGGAITSLRAQEKPSTAPKQQRAEDSSKDPGFARQLAHETREAAGEEEKDDKAEFRRSPSIRWIAKTFGISLETASLLSVLLNFAILAGIVIWAARKYLPGAFSARTAAIQKAIQEAQKASDEARRRLAEIENRLMKLDGEIGMMRDAAEREAAAEEARIHAAAEQDARKIVETTQQEIASAIKAARRELTAYAADLAVGLARKQIHIDAATDRELVRNFAEELVTSEGSAQRPGKDDR